MVRAIGKGAGRGGAARRPSATMAGFRSPAIQFEPILIAAGAGACASAALCFAASRRWTARLLREGSEQSAGLQARLSLATAGGGTPAMSP